MKAFITLIALTISYSISVSYSQKGDLVLKVTNVKTATGKMQIGLYDQGENFPKDGYAYKKIIVPVTSTKFEYTFKNIPLKKYGIVLHHDVNGDDEFNKSIIGWPQEPYAFSNNIRPLSVPPFEKVAFDFNKSKTIVIELID